MALYRLSRLSLSSTAPAEQKITQYLPLAISSSVFSSQRCFTAEIFEVLYLVIHYAGQWRHDH